jgi:hypothetical protein
LRSLRWQWFLIGGFPATEHGELNGSGFNGCGYQNQDFQLRFRG